MTEVGYPKLANIPLHNLLEEFLLFRDLLASEQFGCQLSSVGLRPVSTPLLEWYGQAEDLLSLILQRAILGVESYVIGAVWIEMGTQGRLTSGMNEKIRNPFRIVRGGGTALSYYHHLPSLLSPTLSLRERQPELWEQVEGFYRHLRNPLFHGQQLDTKNPADITPFLALIQSIYDWVSTWHPLEVTNLNPKYIVLKLRGKHAELKG